MKLYPLLNGILFVFNEQLEQGKFVEYHGKVYVGKSDDSSIKNARWGKVIAIGPDVKDDGIKVGKHILIEPLAWTKGLEYDGIKIWRTDESRVMAVSE